MNALKLDQGSEEWLKARLGVITASNISKVLAKKGSETRNGYMAELVGQVCTGVPEEINGKALEFGKINEVAARAAYSFETGYKIDEVGFIYGHDKRTGCSPDGLIHNLNKGLELKVPFTSRVYIEFLCSGKIKKEYLDQVGFCLWITGYSSWDFVNFNPRMKKNMIHIQTIERDEKQMAIFNEAIPEFVHEMDLMLEKAGFKWGEQWHV